MSYIKYLLFLSDLNETWIFSTDFRKILKCQILCNLFGGSLVVPCGQTEDRRADKTNVIVAFRDFAKARYKLIIYSAEVKNEWRYASSPPVCPYSLHSDNFTFYAP